MTHNRYEWVTSHIWTRHVTHEWVTSHIWTRHVTHEWVTPHNANRTVNDTSGMEQFSCDVTHLCVTWLMHIFDVARWYVWRDSSICVRSVNDRSGIEQSVVRHDALTCVARLVLQCVAVCCSVLQCVAVCCSVLQCVAVCCSVLQCVTVCCKTFDLTHSYLWHDLFPCVTWFVHTCDMTHSYVWHDLFFLHHSFAFVLCMFVSLQFSAFWGKSNNESDGHILTRHVTSSRVTSHINESRHKCTSHIKFMNAETLPHNESVWGGYD